MRQGQAVSRDEFLADAAALAARLGAATHVLDLCRDRYAFAVTLFAAMLRGLRTDLPSSAAPEVIATLCGAPWGSAPAGLCVSDQPEAPAPGVPYLRMDAGADTHAEVRSTVRAKAAASADPRIEPERHIITVFTSGSTGQPQPHRKTYGQILRNVHSEAQVMWGAAGGPCSVVGTVPSQHMYGLESTILMPLLTGGRLCSRIPFYPADIADALAEAPEPRLLVTTPFHLRTLLEAHIALPRIGAVVCATAALPQELAVETEERLGAPLMEIYGSSETGQMAHRHSARETAFTLMPGVGLRQEGGACIAAGGHLEQPYVLNDAVEILDASRFVLLGRNSDMLNIAGKRNSLNHLNAILAAGPGVRDGVFFLPDPEANGDVERVAAVVVAPELNSHDLLAALRTRIDPLFLPRPLLFVDALPRNATGKIPAAALRELLERRTDVKH
jgi:acyl-coenzyme A synthetase/AMP-(fatty) acid ligase